MWLKMWLSQGSWEEELILDCRVSLNAVTCILIGDGLGSFEADTEDEVMWRWRQRWVWCGHAFRIPRAHQPPPGTERGKGRTRPQSLCGSAILSTWWFGVSGLHSCERINFCCFKPPTLWWFVRAATGHRHKWDMKKSCFSRTDTINMTTVDESSVLLPLCDLTEENKIGYLCVLSVD